MASAEGITVAIESAIHGAIAEALANIEREYGIRVERIDAEWLDVSTCGEPRDVLRELRVVSASRKWLKRDA